jgi:hypothetical protein
MKVEVKDLKKGDEIIISNYSELRYLKLLKAPQLSGILNYYTKVPLHKPLKCLVHAEMATSPFSRKSAMVKKFDDKDLNTIMYKDLEGRDIWLVKRNDEFIFD